MSGIVGIVQLDGAPVSRDLISEMAGSLAFRGPDGQAVWTGPSVAFAHTLLKTTFEAAGEQQPASLDGQVWITADARIDAREDLARELALPDSALSRPDCELILHAYARWGENCANHLLGDFAFAIWDSRVRKLFCARDHFGVKPFYYSRIADTFIFSNTLNCVRLHPKVSDELNELAIADFLIFDYNQDPATTTFAAIQRLPAAHMLIATARGVTTRRYWSLPEGEKIRYRRTRDYVEHFRNLLEAAIADRLRTNRVAISMSGGLDSPSVAAFARKVSPQTKLRAHTCVYDWLIPDDERHYSGIVANALGIPIEYYLNDEMRPFEGTLECPTPEPLHNPLSAISSRYYSRISQDASVVLTGYGADPLFCLSPLISWASMRAVPLCHTAVNFARYSWEMRAIPKFRLRSTFLHLLDQSPQFRPIVPAWVDVDFGRRCDLRARLEAGSELVRQNELRPLARRSLRSIYWPTHFETDETVWPSGIVESRHPYFDTRLVQYLLAIPELPNSMDKYLLRLTLKGLLPEPVRTRPKTPLRADPLLAAFEQYGFVQPSKLHCTLYNFVSPTAIPSIERNCSAEQLWSNLRPISLNYWLSSQEKIPALWKTTKILKHDFLMKHPNCVSMGMSGN